MAQIVMHPCVVCYKEVYPCQEAQSVLWHACSGWLNSHGSTQISLYMMLTLLHDEASLAPIQVHLVSDNKVKRHQSSMGPVSEWGYEYTTAFACLCTVVRCKSTCLNGVNFKFNLCGACMCGASYGHSQHYIIIMLLIINIFLCKFSSLVFVR